MPPNSFQEGLCLSVVASHPACPSTRHAQAHNRGGGQRGRLEIGLGNPFSVAAVARPSLTVSLFGAMLPLLGGSGKVYRDDASPSRD